MNPASNLAHELAALDLGKIDLPAALQHLATHARRLFGITCRFAPPDAALPLEPAIVTQLYKIAQEAVTNAIKHGKARNIALSLSHNSGRLVLTIQNDGLALPDLRSKSTGMGVPIMNHRASLISATLEVKAAGPRGGTVVTCSLPFETTGPTADGSQSKDRHPEPTSRPAPGQHPPPSHSTKRFNTKG